MDQKYVVKYKNQTITQALSKADLIDELKNHLEAEVDKIKESPDGRWKDPFIFEFYNELTFKQELGFLTKIRKKNEVQIEQRKVNIPDQNNDEEIKEEPLIEVSSIEDTREEDKVKESKPEEEVPEEKELTKTFLKKDLSSEEFSGDKTVVNTETLKFLEEEKKRKEAEEELKKLRDIEKQKEEELQHLEENITSEATQFIDINALKNSEESTDSKVPIVEDLKELDAISEEFEKQELENLQERDRIEALEDKIDEDDDEESEEEEEGNSKRKKIVLFAIVIGLVVVLLSPEKDVKKKKIFKPAKIEILFPVPFDKADLKKSKKFAEAAYNNYKEFTFSKLVKAAKLYRLAVENNYKDNELIAKLILTYGELIKFSRNNKVDAQLLFKLLQVKQADLSNNVDYTTAKALFFMSSKKYATAVRVIKKYLKLKNKPNFRLFSIFLTALYHTGGFEKAEEVYNKLKEQKNIFNPRVYEEMIRYKSAINDTESTVEIINEALKTHPNSVPILLEQTKVLLATENYKDLAITLNEIKKNLYEGSTQYYSYFLIYHGKLSMIQKKNKEAKAYFEKALKLDSSLDIRSTIAVLDENKVPEAKSIIKESKAIDLIHKSKQELNNGDWRKAVLYAVEAVDIAPEFMGARVHLSTVQIRQGNFEKAINQLQQLHRKYPQNTNVNFALLKSYIDAYQFSKARNLLSSIGNSDLRNNYKFSSLQGYMYSKMSLHLEAIKWYRNSINTNPVNDKDFYALSQEYFSLIKRSKDKGKLLNRCKYMLAKAIELAPDNARYRVAYSKVLYEESGADTAIGYLRELSRDFPFNALLMSEIAINYFKIGNLKKFEDLKKQIKQLPDKKGDFYEFLVNAALLDEKYNDVIKYGEELLAIKPGDLKTRMLIGEILLERADKGDLAEAVKYFRSVAKRLDSYPRVNLNIGKLGVLNGEENEAMVFFEKEMKHNPEIIDTYLEMAKIYAKRKDFVSAEKYYQKAQNKNPGSVKALMGMAYLSLQKNQLEVALELLQKALRTEPSNAQLHKLIGDAYRLMGQSGLAIKSYKAHLEFNEDSKYRAELETYIKNFD